MTLKEIAAEMYAKCHHAHGERAYLCQHHVEALAARVVEECARVCGGKKAGAAIRQWTEGAGGDDGR